MVRMGTDGVRCWREKGEAGFLVRNPCKSSNPWFSSRRWIHFSRTIFCWKTVAAVCDRRVRWQAGRLHYAAAELGTERVRHGGHASSGRKMFDFSGLSLASRPIQAGWAGSSSGRFVIL